MIDKVLDKGSLKRAMRQEGFELHPLKRRAVYLKKYGFTPATVFDIGVGDGTRWLYKAYPDAHFVLVDPIEGALEKVCKEYNFAECDIYEVALGAEPGQAELRIPTTEKGPALELSSLHKRTDRMVNHFIEVTTKTVPMTTLDKISREHQGPFGIKIDTEGFEVPILQGARETLRRAEFVILELGVSHRFDRTFRPSQATSLLAEAGLEFRDVLATAHAAGRHGRPRHMDVLYTRWI